MRLLHLQGSAQYRCISPPNSRLSSIYRTGCSVHNIAVSLLQKVDCPQSTELAVQYTISLYLSSKHYTVLTLHIWLFSTQYRCISPPNIILSSIYKSGCSVHNIAVSLQTLYCPQSTYLAVQYTISLYLSSKR